MKSLHLNKQYSSDDDLFQNKSDLQLKLDQQIPICLDDLSNESDFSIQNHEQLLHSILNFLPVPLIITRQKNGQIVMISQGVENILQIKKAAIIGNNIDEPSFILMCTPSVFLFIILEILFTFDNNSSLNLK